MSSDAQVLLEVWLDVVLRISRALAVSMRFSDNRLLAPLHDIAPARETMGPLGNSLFAASADDLSGRDALTGSVRRAP